MLSDVSGRKKTHSPVRRFINNDPLVPKRSRGSLLGLALFGLTLLTNCTRPNENYCDEQVPCRSGFQCEDFACVASTAVDGGAADARDAQDEGGQAMFQLTVGKSGTGAGTVRSAATAIHCGTVCEETLSKDTQVTLTATAEGGSEFLGWSGDCSGSGSCVLTLNADKVVVANFGARHRLTVSRVGSAKNSGRIFSNPSGINCQSPQEDCTELYSHGTRVTLTAGFLGIASFRWSGACSGSQLTCTLTMDGPKDVTATFNPILLPPGGVI